jgi:hypothetical protein
MTVDTLSPYPPASHPHGPRAVSRGSHQVGHRPPAVRWAMPTAGARPTQAPRSPTPRGSLSVRELDGLLGQCRRQARLATLLLVEVLPTHPETADALMLAIAQRLRGSLRTGDAMALVGEMGIAVLMFDVGESSSPGVRNRLDALLREPYALGAGWARPLLRIGRAVCGLDGQHAAELLRAAALAPR